MLGEAGLGVLWSLCSEAWRRRCEEHRENIIGSTVIGLAQDLAGV